MHSLPTDALMIDWMEDVAQSHDHCDDFAHDGRDKKG
jgi:hypothetical protein